MSESQGRTCAVCGEGIAGRVALLKGGDTAHWRCWRLDAQRRKWGIPDAPALGAARAQHRAERAAAMDRDEVLP